MRLWSEECECTTNTVILSERKSPFESYLRHVTSLGVLFDFTGNAEKTTVQNVEDMVKESWVS